MKRNQTNQREIEVREERHEVEKEDRHLLKKLEVIEVEVLFKTIRRGEKLTLVSDGGLKARGAFVWIIAKKIILAKCRCPASRERRHMSL